MSIILWLVVVNVEVIQFVRVVARYDQSDQYLTAWSIHEYKDW